MERLLSIGLQSSCHNDFYKEQIRATQRTWVKSCPYPVYYFAGSARDEEFSVSDIFKIHHFDVIDNHDSCMIKQFRGLQYLYDYSPSQFYFFGDTDTYLHISNLEKLLKKYSPQEDLYLGGHGSVRKINKELYFHSGGAGFILSHKTLEKLIPNIDKILVEWSLVCHQYGVDYLFSSCDVTIAYYLDQLGIRPTIVDDIYACNYKGLAQENICCRHVNPEKIISCHYMSKDDMYYYHTYLHLKEQEHINNWTLVTMFYDLQIGMRDKSYYYQHCQLLISLQQNFVIFCSSRSLNEIYEMRKKYNLIDKTLFIVKEFTDLPLYPYIEKIRSNRQNILPCADPRNTPEYFALVSSKFTLLQDVIEQNPFTSSHFGWIDFGYEKCNPLNLLHLSSSLRENRSKVSFCYIDYTEEGLMKDPRQYYLYGRCGIACNFFTGDREYLQKLCIQFKEKFIHSINEGYGHAEEQLIPLIYLDHPDLFDFYFGDYGQTILNYSHIQENPYITLNNFIPKVLADKKYSLGYKAAHKIYESYQKGLFYLSPHHHISLLELYFLTSWMTDREKCLSLIEEIKGLITKPNYLTEIYRRQKYLFYNLDLAYHLLPPQRNVAVYTQRRLPSPEPQTKIFLYGNYGLSSQSFITENPVIRPRELPSRIPYDEEIHPTITFITSFFDLGKRENNTQRKQSHVYLEKSLFVLNLDVNLVIFIEEEYVDYVTEHRKPFEKKTKIIPMKFEDLHYYQHYEEIAQNMKTHPIHNSSSYKDTPNYIILMWEKLEFVKKAIEDNPFKSDYFAWIDFGLTHVAKTQKCLKNETFTKVPEKIKIMKLREFSYNEFNDLRSYYSYLRGIMAAGYMTGSLENMLIFHRLMNIEISRCLEMKVAPVDEQILPIVISKCPELFILYNGDYEDILDNYY